MSLCVWKEFVKTTSAETQSFGTLVQMQLTNNTGVDKVGIRILIQDGPEHHPNRPQWIYGNLPSATRNFCRGR